MRSGLEKGLGDGFVTFPVDHCGHCGGDVLVYPRLEVEPSGRSLVWRCIFCDHELEGTGRTVVYRSLGELIIQAIETESPDMDDGWPPLDFPLDAWGSDDGGK